MIPKSYEHEFVSFIERNSDGGIAFMMAPRLSQMETIMNQPGKRRTFKHYLQLEEFLWFRHEEEMSKIETDPHWFRDDGETSASDQREQAQYDLEMEFRASINRHREHALTQTPRRRTPMMMPSKQAPAMSPAEMTAEIDGWLFGVQRSFDLSRTHCHCSLVLAGILDDAKSLEQAKAEEDQHR